MKKGRFVSNDTAFFVIKKIMIVAFNEIASSAKRIFSFQQVLVQRFHWPVVPQVLVLVAAALRVNARLRNGKARLPIHCVETLHQNYCGAMIRLLNYCDDSNLRLNYFAAVVFRSACDEPVLLASQFPQE